VFSGIVETVQPILTATKLEGLVRLQVKRPEDFNDLKIGDSVAFNGICLTVEAFDQGTIQFALAAETLKILKWPEASSLVGTRVNLERSLRYGDRIHGHLVSGHVDSLGSVVKAERLGESLFLTVQVPRTILPYVWNKGSVTLHGVSLTINSLVGDQIEVCLIPETQKRTNLGDLKVGEPVHVEPDWMAKALQRALENQISTRLEAGKEVST
jgi:riboflavin synthase